MTKTAGALSAGILIKDLGKHIHPEGRKKLIAGGLFDKLAKVINIANKAYNVVDKGIKIGTKAYSAGQSFKKAYDGMKAGELDTSGAVQGDMVVMAKPRKRGGKLKAGAMSAGKLTAGSMPTAGAMPTGGAVKKKRTLPPALRDRAKRMGELMKAGKTMKQASEMYKEEQKK
jgi:hypothetical protein